MAFRPFDESDHFVKSFNESYELYKKYQIHVQGESESDTTVMQFKSFFYKSTLNPIKQNFNINGITGYGTFIVQYRYKGCLYAISLIDILPQYISSVYFCYDPEFACLSLGSFSVLVEIRFTQLLHAYSENIRYNTLGYYIKNCHKMLYKANFSPSYLLCPVSYKWVSYDECSNKFDLTLLKKLDSSCSTKKNDLSNPLCTVPLVVNNKIINTTCDESHHLKEYINLVGKYLASEMLLFE